MRNPLNSWDKGDTQPEPSPFGAPPVKIGENDLKLAQKLIRAGSDHSKFMRQILVCMDITAPLYWWKEMDTYKVATVANSTSTMHTITKKPITIKDFSIDGSTSDSFGQSINSIVWMCEDLRKSFIQTKDPIYWRSLIQILPCAYNQRRTWTANYQTLRNIYFARRFHKLNEWIEFCEVIKNLPYGEDLICLEDE